MNAAPTVIRADGLTKRFGDFTAVDQVDLAVAAGSIFAFLGANGSGKSTTIRMLIGLLEPTAGTIEVDGIDVIREPRKVRDHVGYMGQKVSLYAGLTLRENVEFYAGLYGIAGRDLERRWSELRERFVLAELERERTEDLPAGVRQRAGLALATIHRPRILFLDEPTAGVDVESRALFWDRIRDEADGGVTVFVTTHFLEEVDYCDWVSFIDRGALVADAAPEELRARYSHGYRLRFEPDPGRAGELAPLLEELGARVEHEQRTVVATVPRLEGPLFSRLERLAEGGVGVEIEPAPMTEVFRRILLEAEERR